MVAINAKYYHHSQHYQDQLPCTVTTALPRLLQLLYRTTNSTSITTVTQTHCKEPLLYDGLTAGVNVMKQLHSRHREEQALEVVRTA